MDDKVTITPGFESQDLGLPPSRESPIRVCFTGRNRAGSWVIRAQQISGRRSNWHASPEITEADINHFDLFCFVKRPIPKLMHRLHKFGKLIVYDIVDAWAQPDDGLAYTTLKSVREMFGERWRGLPNIHGFIFANRAMQRDLSSLVRHGTFIYHHYYPLLPPNPIRQDATTVGYQGNVSYLGEWRQTIESVCARLGQRFLINPDDSREIDIGIATRGGEHDCFLSNSYKSNVKLANFYGAGTPCVVSAKDRSYQETDQGDVRFFTDESDLELSIRSLLPRDVRVVAHEKFLSAAHLYNIEVIADAFEHYFLEVARQHRSGRLL